MSPPRYRIHDESYPYFVTSGIMFGLPIFSNVYAAEIIIENLIFLCTEREVDIIAYVIMENHFHAIFHGTNLKVKIGSFKSFSAREIIDLFEWKGNREWLKRLKSVKGKNKADRNYQLWQGGFHPKQIFSDEVMIQKIEYIHNNPVKRGYVDKQEDWRYSSARDYAGLKGPVPVTLFER